MYSVCFCVGWGTPLEMSSWLDGHSGGLIEFNFVCAQKLCLRSFIASKPMPLLLAIIDSCDLEFYGAYPRLCFYSCDLKFLDLNHGPRSWCLLHIDLVIANHILRGFSRPVIANHFWVISVISSSQIMWTAGVQCGRSGWTEKETRKCWRFM